MSCSARGSSAGIAFSCSRTISATGVVTLATNILYNTMLTDMETCYKVMRIEVLRSLTLESNGFGIEPEITAKIFKRGYRVYEVPITYAGRGYDEGKKITWRAGFDRAVGPVEVPVHRIADRSQTPATVKIALLQINPTVGDLARQRAADRERPREAARDAAPTWPSRRSWRSSATCRAICSSARASCAQSWAASRRARRELADAARRRWSAFPSRIRPTRGGRSSTARRCCAAAAIEQRFRKALLPTYDVFDEDRYFEPFHGRADPRARRARGSASASAKTSGTIATSGSGAAITTIRSRSWSRAGAQAIVNLSASPFSVGKHHLREEMLGSMARKHRVPLVYVNQFGGNDDLVFDGRSCAFDARRRADRARPLVRRRRRASAISTADAPIGACRPISTPESEIWRALVLGTRDYARKCGFSPRRARPVGRHRLGADRGDRRRGARPGERARRAHAVAVFEPRQHRRFAGARREPRHRDADPADRAGHAARWSGTLRDAFAGTARDVTEENIQARIRGNLLMALSNKRGALLLTTGNKSELAVGYCTLYGDMSGGLGVIADVPKTMVYRVARWLNDREGRAVIPEAILTKAPSAELRPNQTDQDSLPPYDVLDEILQRHIERHEPADEIVAAGFDAATVHRVLRLVRGAEFKRKQAAPGTEGDRPRVRHRDGGCRSPRDRS